MSVSPSEIGAAVVGLLLGYWAISAMIPRKKANPGAKPETPPPNDPPASSAQNIPLTWYEVLGVPAFASADEIRSAYRARVSKYHPDKVDALGDEIRVVALQMTKQIMAAYREGMRRHGVEV